MIFSRRQARYSFDTGTHPGMTRPIAKPSAIPVPTSRQVLAWTASMAALSIVLQVLVGG